MSTTWRKSQSGRSVHEKTVGCDADGCIPVVVIDPEDREQVKALIDAAGKCPRNGEAWCVSKDCCTDRIQSALRSLIAPPKPAEPQGLGAVVEDAEGVRWVRWVQRHRERRDWRKCVENGGIYAAYVDIAAVKVLSEGVTA